MFRHRLGGMLRFVERPRQQDAHRKSGKQPACDEAVETKHEGGGGLRRRGILHEELTSLTG
jgi:hypothetical protein